ncbi:MAG: M1 family metallopeptidase [Candidatus Thorarchaeota archaeon]
MNYLRKLLLVFSFISILCCTTGSQCIVDSNFKLNQNLDEHLTNDSLLLPSLSSSSTRVPLAVSYPLTNYTIIAALNPLTNSVSAISNIFYVNHVNVTLNELVFHIYPNAFQPYGNIQILSVQSNGINLLYTITGSDQTILTIDLVGGSGPGPLSFMEIIELDLEYNIYLPYRQDRFGWYNTSSPFEFLAYNLGNWHPIVAVYDDRGWDTKPYSHMGESFYSDVATYDVHLTVPEDYVVAATGEFQNKTSGSETSTWYYSTGPVRDFTWCASPHFQMTSISVDGVNVTSYYITEHEPGGLRVLEVAEECLSVFGNHFGNYVWPSLHVVETDFWSGGMEYPQLVMIGSSLYDSPEGLSSLATVTAHEIGHQWIPFTLGTDSYSEPWIDEGFASFTEYLWVENVYGSSARAEYRLYDLDRYWEFVEAVQDYSINQSMTYWQTTSWYEYGRIVYAKAALVYDMLRHQVGNEAYYQAWRDIFSQAIHTNIRAQALQGLFEASIGESLDWFFNQWVFGNGIVLLSLGTVTVVQWNNQWNITLQLYQNSATPLPLRVPIIVTFAGAQEEFWVLMEAEPVTILTVTVSTTPLTLLLDPNRLLLCQYITNAVSLSALPAILTTITIVAIIVIIIVVIVIFLRRRSSKSPN